ncbi:hypothetical protein [Bosea sp. TAF32]|uniref:hypothetical protein n=1 Tax=Bosea sp. TAF32 TaxID=3237482 RepID=UPI003F8E15B7
MAEDEQEAWLRKLKEARRLMMVHYLADRHDEGDKMKRLAADLEQLGRSRAWPIPDEEYARKSDR